MALRPNYRQERNQRARNKEQKAAEKRRRRDGGTADTAPDENLLPANQGASGLALVDGSGDLDPGIPRFAIGPQQPDGIPVVDTRQQDRVIATCPTVERAIALVRFMNSRSG